jgi:hypothetical protein
MKWWAKVLEFLHWDSADGWFSFVGRSATSPFGVFHVFTCRALWVLTWDPALDDMS